MNGFVFIALLAASTAGDPAAADPALGRLQWGDPVERPAFDLRAASATRPETASALLFGAEDPAASGARFGIGVDYATDRLEAFDVTAFTTDFEVAGAQFPGTPEDAAREMELTLVGAQVPIALGHLGPLSISLVLEAASVEGEAQMPVLDPRDGDDIGYFSPTARYVDPAQNSAFRTARYDGEGTLLGGGLDAAAPLGGRGAFLGLGYRFRTLRGFELDPDEPAGELTSPLLPAELDRDDHQVTARLGWSLAGGRFAPYGGARAHRIETVVDGEILAFRDVRVPTRLELESEEVVGLAGFDVRLGGFVGRVEGTFGGDRETVLVKLVRGFGGSGAPPRHRPVGPGAEPPQPGEPTVEEKRRRADEIAEDLAPRIRDVQRRFEQGRRRLDTVQRPGGPVYDPRGLLALLTTTEADLLAALQAPELAPLRAWITVFFAGLRDDLPEATVSRALTAPGHRPRPVFASLAAAAQGGGPAGSARDRQESVLDRVAGFLSELLARTEAGELTTDICLSSVPESGVEVRLYAPRYTQRVVREVTQRTASVVYRGLYAYEVEPPAGEGFECTDVGRPCDLVDLWLHDGPFVVCDFSIETCLPRPGDLDECLQR